MRPTETLIEARSALEAQFETLGLPKSLVEEIVSHHTVVNYAKGSMVCLQGSPADLLFWVISGFLKVYFPLPDGARILVNLVKPGDLTGHVDYVDTKGRRAQVFEIEAMSKCAIAIFTREQAMKLLQSLDPSILVQILERLNSAWSSAARRFTGFLGMSLRERLELVFDELGAKLGVRDTRGVLLTAELTHDDLADMIGSSRPMVSRLLGEMTDQGLILRQGKQFVLLDKPAEQKVDCPNQSIQKRGPVADRPRLQPLHSPMYIDHGYRSNSISGK